jgi:hypothetical protein
LVGLPSITAAERVRPSCAVEGHPGIPNKMWPEHDTSARSWLETGVALAITLSGGGLALLLIAKSVLLGSLEAAARDRRRARA